MFGLFKNSLKVPQIALMINQLSALYLFSKEQIKELGGTCL